MIEMKQVLIAAAAALALAGAAFASPSTTPGRVEFDVTRNGQPFGRHTVVVNRAPDGQLNVRNEATLRATVGPVTVYRYELRCSEAWRGGELHAMQCDTRKNGRNLSMTATRTPTQVTTQGSGGAHVFPLNVAPTSWWTRAALTGRPLIDAETGAPMNVRVRRVGMETITVNGRPIQAERFTVQGTLAVDLWYDRSGRWVGCRFTAQGQTIEYRLTSPVEAAPA
jgi:hypothetical protein